jgi:hypothetical protein
MSADGVLLTQMDLFGGKPSDDDDDSFDDLDDFDPVGLSQDLDPLPTVKLPVLQIPLKRPKTREGCAAVPRPCPFVSCRHNLYLDVSEDGRLRLNFPDREPDQMTASCVLDLVNDGPRILDTIGGLMGLSKERARQIEVSGLAKVEARFTPDDVD